MDSSVNDIFARGNWEFYERTSEASKLNSRLTSVKKRSCNFPCNDEIHLFYK